MTIAAGDFLDDTDAALTAHDGELWHPSAHRGRWLLLVFHRHLR